VFRNRSAMVDKEPMASFRGTCLKTQERCMARAVSLVGPGIATTLNMPLSRSSKPCTFFLGAHDIIPSLTSPNFVQTFILINLFIRVHTKLSYIGETSMSE
jgi:hypothetical protein